MTKTGPTAANGPDLWRSLELNQGATSALRYAGPDFALACFTLLFEFDHSPVAGPPNHCRGLFPHEAASYSVDS